MALTASEARLIAGAIKEYDDDNTIRALVTAALISINRTQSAAAALSNATLEAELIAEV